MQFLSGFQKSVQFIKENRARLFWIWVLYQAVKGALTLTLIWIPLLLLWRNGGGPQGFLRDWGWFVGANGLFFLSYVLFTVPATKQRLKRLIGSSGYQVLFSIVSLLTLALAFSSARLAPQNVVWVSEDYHAVVAIVTISVGLILVTFGMNAPNLFSLFSSRREYAPTQPGICAVTRHPVLWGLALWALGHMLVNGTINWIVFFGLQLVFALLGAFILDRRARSGKSETEWKELAANTSFLPNPLALLTAFQEGSPARKTAVIRCLIATVVILGLILAHPPVFGVFPLKTAGPG